ncbi:MAG: CRISPR-associated endonuclease Cas1, partial [Candidatus Hydrogenedentes bacterium]|nr:CRISPR-associated endonuclease Cas1 [Candidatus Hydrogenedentota bacterium]
LSASSFAFRRGLNREGAVEALHRARREGFCHGIKADIASFYDNVRWDDLERRLRLLYGEDPVSRWLTRWASASALSSAGHAIERTQGLPQGMALSPLLANLLLDIFDGQLNSHALRLVRYCDDFVVLTRQDNHEHALAHVREALATLGLKLREDKLEHLGRESAFTFLGYRVEPGKTADSMPEEEDTDAVESGIFSRLATGKRTVYLAGDVRNARCRGEALVLLNKEFEPVTELPWKQIGRIVASGRVATTSAVQRAAMQRGVPILYLNLWGRILGEAVPACAPRPSLAKVQSELREDEAWRLAFVRELAATRIHNIRVVLRRHKIDEKEIKGFQQHAETAMTVDSVRGYEGLAARAYWSHLRDLVAPFPFEGRKYRPPPDPVNAMLSLLYTLMHHRLASLLRHHGFEPVLGIYHVSHGAHAALASDLMEQFRHFIELIVLRVVRHRMVTPEQFQPAAPGQVCVLPPEVFKTLVLAFERRLQKAFTTRKGDTLTLMECMEEQIRDLRASLLLRQPHTPLRVD